MKTKTALVTGSTGFIGSHLVEDLISRGWKVSCLVRPESRTDFLDLKPVRILRGRSNDRSHLEHALQGQDYVFHLAARIRAATLDLYEQANYVYTMNLIQSCLCVKPMVKRFTYVSSVAAAGPSAAGVIQDETMPCAPVSDYGRTKLRGESAVKALWDKIPVTIIRPPNVFGPRQPETELLIRLIRSRIVPVLKNRGKTTCFINIKDLIAGMLLAALNPKASGEIYYLTDGQTYSWQEVVSTLRDCVLGDSLYLPLPESAIRSAARVADVLKTIKLMRTRFGRSVWRSMTQRAWLFSPKKAVRDLGFQPHFSLETGLRDMLACKDRSSRN
ncbi:MAG: NAD-dependent epimerase/dehydratase family protein [Candidatus Aminicenantes bacterium]|nr:NAD-dependent epimerase/dehydratase family protein [Candidatus Aminicenantes bacterium]